MIKKLSPVVIVMPLLPIMLWIYLGETIYYDDAGRYLLSALYGVSISLALCFPDLNLFKSTFLVLLVVTAACSVSLQPEVAAHLIIFTVLAMIYGILKYPMPKGLIAGASGASAMLALSLILPGIVDLLSCLPGS